MTKAKPDISEFEALDETIELRKQLEKTQNQLRRAKSKTADLIEAVHDGAKDAALVLGKSPKVPKPQLSTQKGKPEIALLHLSDLHFGKKTESFGSQVAANRVRRLSSLVLRLTDIERADHPVRECHVMLGGDFIENTNIFPGQAYEVDSTTFKQLFASAKATTELLRQMLAYFEKVHVWEEYGNHGRMGKKGEVPGEDSLDLMSYRLSREQLSDYVDSNRLIWNETQGWYSMVDVGNYRAMLVHGDEIKQFGGNTPAFGIMRKVNQWSTGVVERFDDCYMGHFHTPMELPIAHGRGRIFVNPSIESDSTFAKEFMASNGTPGQRLNFIEPKKGRVTTERIVWLDD